MDPIIPNPTPVQPVQTVVQAQPPQAPSNGSGPMFKIFFILVGIVLIVAVGVGGYALGTKNAPPAEKELLPQPKVVVATPTQAASPSAVPASSPDKAVQAYYDWFLACQKNHFDLAAKGNGYNKSPQEACPYNEPGILTESLVTTLTQVKAFDPILCAQNVPLQVTYETAVISGMHATKIVHTIWVSSSKQNINVGLDQEGGSWKISSITCPQ